MKATLAVLCLLATSAGINAQTVVGEAGRHRCSEWVGWSVDELPRMTGGWVEGYASAKYGPDYLSANVLSFMSSYREQWPTATLFETIDMAYRYGAKRWDPLGGPQPRDAPDQEFLWVKCAPARHGRSNPTCGRL